MKCINCHHLLEHTFIDLGYSPFSNAYLSKDDLNKPEIWYPLKVMICPHCWLAQTAFQASSKNIFHDHYAYFSSFSSTWLKHAKNYTQQIVKEFKLNASSLICEVASNDGYLLQYFQQLGIPNYGIEPVKILVQESRKKNLSIIEDFFNESLATTLSKQQKQVDLLIANNVLAHVPNIVDFIKSIRILLKDTGLSTIEFPSLQKLIKLKAFDTIYHEHYTYLSLTSLQNLLTPQKLSIFHVEELTTHGGSYRVYIQHQNGPYETQPSVKYILNKEEEMRHISYYKKFQSYVQGIAFHLIKTLIEINSHKVIAYGAAAKGNTLLNYAGIHPYYLSYVVDKNPNKIGMFLPGSHIPIKDEALIRQEKPAYIFILPWNLKEEIQEQLHYIRQWRGKFITAIPNIQIF